jgi:serine O-acetyltransferase
MKVFSNFRKDLDQYKDSNGRMILSEPSLYVIAMYRSGHVIRNIKFMPIRWIFSIIHLPFYIFFSIITGIQIPRGCTIGPGLRIYHYGCIVLNPDTIIGANCTIRHETTIGTRIGDHDVPIIGDNVDIGAGAKILGAIKIGNNVRIGANAVVLIDVPDNATAVGIPAKIILK